MGKKRQCYFEPFKGEDGQFYFHFVAGNGKLQMVSEGYETHFGALKGIDDLRENVALAKIREKKVAPPKTGKKK